MNNFTKRAITGAVYVALTAICLLFSMDSAFLYIFLISLFCLHEFFKILNPEQSKTSRWVGIIYSALVFYYFLLGKEELMFPGDLEGILILGLFALITYQVFTRNERPFQFLGTIFFGYLYITFSLVLLLKIGVDDNEFIMSSAYFNGKKILIVFILIWASDTFAYLAGRAIGKHKLAPKLSPKKTVEGAIGGWLGTILTAWILMKTLGQFELINYIIIASIVFVFGLLGDLLVSRLKRTMNIKDSGNLLPGHGGFLDRFDSILLAGPMVYLYLSFV